VSPSSYAKKLEMLRCRTAIDEVRKSYQAERPLRVKQRNTRGEQMFSALGSTTDIAQ
jgi:hypothetical protein